MERKRRRRRNDGKRAARRGEDRGCRVRKGASRFTLFAFHENVLHRFGLIDSNRYLFLIKASLFVEEARGAQN
jgi:hypothetical protein